MNAIAHRDGRARATFRQIEGDLRTGVTHADHQDGTAGERLGIDVVRAVDHRACERVHSGNGRDYRLGIVAGRNHDEASADRNRGAPNDPAVRVAFHSAYSFAEARL